MTMPLYLEDAYLKEMEATIIEVTKESDNPWQIVLDKTIFYPRGGGQSTDQGFLFIEGWKVKVSQALLKEDKIIHYVEDRRPGPFYINFLFHSDRYISHQFLCFSNKD